MKIAFIGQKGIPARFGGVERHVEELSKRLAQNGHEVFVYVRNNYTDNNINIYEGVKLIHLPSIPTKNLDAISHTFLATIHALFQNYDIIHYHSIGPSTLSVLVKYLKRNTVLVATYHCQDYLHKKWGSFAKMYLKLGEYVISRFPNKTITVSNKIGNIVYKKSKRKNKPIVIPNGMSVFFDKNHDELGKWGLTRGSYLLCVSRLIGHKGIHYAIDAFKNIERKNLTRGKKLVIVGDGFYTDNYVRELKLNACQSENIIFTGNQTGKTLSQLFSHAYLFIQPSEYEGLSIALLEAMGYGKASLVSNIEENLEAIALGGGLTFRSRNIIDLENKLAYMINNPSVIKKMGEVAKKKAEKKYSWDTIVEKIEELYKELIKIHA